MSSVLLTVAGTDPSGGAGVQVDLQVFRDWGFHGCSVISAVIAQNTSGIERFESVEPALFAAQLDSVLDDIDIRGVKIGVIPNADLIEILGDKLRAYSSLPVVLDPVFASGVTGQSLRDEETAAVLEDELAGVVDVVTPNVDEASVLAKTEISSIERLKNVASILQKRWETSFVVKGGHLAEGNEPVVDYFASSEGGSELAGLQPVDADVRGTGCQLSSAILVASVNRGAIETAAIEEARRYLNRLLHNQIRDIGEGRPVVVRK